MSKTKKRLTVIGVILLLLCLFVFAAFYSIHKKAEKTVIGNVDLTDKADGVYTGEYTISPVAVKVKVTVRNKIITDIVLEKHNNGLGEKAEVLTKQIVEQQNINQPLITGATVSSKVILKAVENALQIP